MTHVSHPPRRNGAFRAALSRHRADSVLTRHRHAGASLSIVFAGSYVERIGRCSWRCEPLSVLWKPPGVVHSNHVGATGLRAMFVEVSAEDAQAFVAEEPRLTDPRAASVADAIAFAARIQAAAANVEFGERVVAGELVREILRVAAGTESRPATRDPRAWFDHVLTYLQAHHRHALTLAKVAAIGGVHPVHLAQTFRQELGCTFREHLRGLRLESARQALRDAARTIGQVGIAAGFADHAHFSREFRARYGLTPSDYRRVSGVDPRSDAGSPTARSR